MAQQIMSIDSGFPATGSRGNNLVKHYREIGQANLREVD